MKKMADGKHTEWIGSVVSVDCGETLGSFQGHVETVDEEAQTIKLVNPYHNGKQSLVSPITIRAQDINHLVILKSADEVDASNTICSNGNGLGDRLCNDYPVKHSCLSKTRAVQSESKHACTYHWPTRRSGSAKNDDCLTMPISKYVLEQDFDFEKNLALFDKEAVFGEIKAVLEADRTKLVDINCPSRTNYRCDENVLGQIMYFHRQIKVPHPGKREYFTDTDIVIPSITLELRNKILSAANEAGLSWGRQTELLGRAASDMVLQLLGGSRRLNPKNSHQIPSAVMLCGSHVQGVYALCCGRHLLNHGVNVSAFVPTKSSPGAPGFQEELALFRLAGGKTNDLPTETTDIIINGLHGHSEQSDRTCADWYTDVLNFTHNSKASVLTLDPPVEGVLLQTKWSLCPVLPLDIDLSMESIYLCDLSIPEEIFTRLGISYKSPFGAKSVIPLRCNSSCN